MADYRCYRINRSGSIDGPAQVIDRTDDASAIVEAHEIFPGHHFEIWQGTRRVYRKPPPISG